MSVLRTLFPTVLISLGILSPTNAGDWPQVLGPERNGMARKESVGIDWPNGRPPVVWQHTVGSGFAGPAVQGSTVIAYHRMGREEVVEALDGDTGEATWRVTFPTEYAPSYTSDDGPRVVPLITGDRVILYGALGELRCLDLESGEVIWQRKTFEEFNAAKYRGSEPPEGYFGVGSSPIVVGDKVIVNVGGDEKQAGIVAFNTATGETVWQSTSERASYSSPVLANVEGTNHLLVATRLNFLSLNPESGEVRFQVPFGRSGPTVTAANPVVIDHHVFLTASYGIGSAWIELSRDSGEVVWRDTDILASQYTTCIEFKGSLVGIDGRQDGPAADLKCFDPFTRTVHWVEPAFGYATLLMTADKLLAMKTDGELVVISPSKDGYRELARTELFATTTRALPALADGRFYARDTRNLKCFDLRSGL